MELLERTVIKHNKQLEQLTASVNKTVQEMTKVINKQGDYIAHLVNDLNAVKSALAQLQKKAEEQPTVQIVPGFSRN